MHARRPGSPFPPAFEKLEASVLFCARCQAPRPVRERLLLVLPDGELHEYLCSGCGSSVGSRKVTSPASIVLTS